MRKATPELTEYLQGLYDKDVGYEAFTVEVLKIDYKYLPTIWRILEEEEGVGWKTENRIRELIDWEPLPPENKIINLSVYQPIRIKGDPRPYRTSLQINNKEVAEAIRREAKRQGITITELLAKRFGVAL